VNCCINHLKNQRKLKFLPLKIFTQKDKSYLSIEPQIPLEVAEKREKLYSAIDSLPPKLKAVIIFYYFEDRSCEEMADILNCSIGTIKSRLFHARKSLKKKLEPYLRNGECVNSRSEVVGEGYEMFKM